MRFMVCRDEGQGFGHTIANANQRGFTGESDRSRATAPARSDDRIRE